MNHSDFTQASWANLCIDILGTVVGNGRLEMTDEDGRGQRVAELEVEIAHEAMVRGLDDESVTLAVAFAKDHINWDGIGAVDSPDLDMASYRVKFEQDQNPFIDHLFNRDTDYQPCSFIEEDDDGNCTYEYTFLASYAPAFEEFMRQHGDVLSVERINAEPSQNHDMSDAIRYLTLLEKVPVIESLNMRQARPTMIVLDNPMNDLADPEDYGWSPDTYEDPGLYCYVDESLQWLVDTIGGELVFMLAIRPGLFDPYGEDAGFAEGEYPTTMRETTRGYINGHLVCLGKDDDGLLYAGCTIGNGGKAEYLNNGLFRISQEDYDRISTLMEDQRMVTLQLLKDSAIMLDDDNAGFIPMINAQIKELGLPELKGNSIKEVQKARWIRFNEIRKIQNELNQLYDSWGHFANKEDIDRMKEKIKPLFATYCNREVARWWIAQAQGNHFGYIGQWIESVAKDDE